MGAGGRVAVRRGKMDDDDEEEVEEDDAEYVAAASSDEDAGGEEEEDPEPEPDHESDADFDGDEEAEDEDFEIEAPRPRPRRRPAPKARGRGRKAAKPDSSSSDADFDEDEDLKIEAPRAKPKPKRAAAKHRGRGRKARPRQDDDSDADFDEDEELDDETFQIEAPRPRRPARARGRGRKVKKPRDDSDEDFGEDEGFEIEAPRQRRPAPARSQRGSRKGKPRDDSDEDFGEDDELEDEGFEIEATRQRRPATSRSRGGRKGKPRHVSDEDFSEDEELEDDGFEIEPPRQRRPATARTRRGRKGKPHHDSDEDFGEDEELEDDSFEIEAPRQRRPATVRPRGGRKGKQEDESDADFDVGEEKLEIETRPAAVRSRGGRKGSQEDESDADFDMGDEKLEIEAHPATVLSRGGRKGSQEDESDAGFGGDEEELEDEELGIETRPAEVPSCGRTGDESDADFDGEEELEDEGSEMETPQPEHQNGRQDDKLDDDFYKEQEDQEADGEELETETPQPTQPVEGCGWGRKRKPTGSRRPRHEDDDDYEEEIEDEDEDFDPEVDEHEDEEEEEVPEDDEDLDEYAPTRAKNVRPKSHLAKRKPVAGRKHRKRSSGSRVSKGKARKGTSAHQRRRKQWVADDDEDEEEDDDDFVVEDDVEEEVDYWPRKKAKVGGVTGDGTSEPVAVGETWPSVESDTSEFEFVTSEEEDAKNEAPITESVKIKRKKGRRKKGSESDSSSDSDYVISEEELKDLGVPRPQETVPQPPLPTARRTIVPRRVDEKGKEPEEALKQICGICLSEEQRATIQGVLNCCSHYFCFACILEWSKVESKCPLCKRRFNTVTKSSVADVGSGLRNAAIRVDKRDQVYQPTEEEMRRWLDPYENVVCIECNQGGEDNLMLLCDICDSSAHTFCVGLGREVPEGNWYCGGCRFSVEGPYAQTQDRVVHRGESNMSTADGSSSSFGRTVSSGVFQRPPPLNIDQPSLQGFDLNLSPIETPDEDKRAESHISAEPVSTPTGRHATLDRRRALNRRIRILLFRPRTATNAWQNGLQHDRTTPGTEQNQRSTCTSTEDSPSCSRADLLQSQQSSSHFVQSASNLAQFSYEGGNNFREVENAKEQLIPIVKKSIKHICAQSPLDQSSFMNVARRATNTILALSGIEHNRDRVVTTPFPFPSHCCHACDGQEPAFLMRTICSACFNSFVGDVVSHIAYMFS
ncbi:hypothetical protein ACQ4PT_065932 [Festuca glaucescens]